MPPKKKVKTIVINKETNDILEKHFGGEISLIKGTKLTELFNEGLIDGQMLKFLRAVKQTYNKSEKDEIELNIIYELDEPEKIVITDEINDILEAQFKGDIKQIKLAMLTQLVKDNLITKDQQKFLFNLRKISKKKNFKDLIEYDLKEKSETEPEPEYESNIDAEQEEEEVEEAAVASARESAEAVEEQVEEQVAEEAASEAAADEEPIVKYDKIKESKFIVPHRKAFVDFVNQGFYKQILKETQESDLNVYQILVKEYLSIDTPYRGLLVYHGLGTGKTATAVSMAENVSSDMKITTLLPASLENNFIGEVKRWGKEELDLEGQTWSFIPFDDIEENPTIRKELFKKYKITVDIIREIINHTIREVKKKISLQIIEEDPSIKDNKKELKKQINEKYKKISSSVLVNKGFWKQDKKGVSYSELEPYQQLFLECQIHRLVQMKYNFIHYNPLPTIRKEDEITREDIEEDEGDDLFDDEVVNKRSNEAIKQGLLKQMKYNMKHYDIESPFYNETIIIDEVHNFVREILNDSGSARTFYEWIINAEKVKLVFLSGTPIINKPCEIAVLYNMLKGRIKVYTFTIKSSDDPVDLTSQLNDIFYKKHSSIELFHISRKEGKLIISFTQNQENFVSVMNPDNEVIYTSSSNSHSYENFINDIYTGLDKVFDEDDIIPSKKDALDIDEYKIFDKIVNLPFFRKQTLFEIKHKDEFIDLTNNETFMDYFFSESYDIEGPKKTLLRRMLMGLTSYYPIDRSKIGTMPTITSPQISKDYENYTISKNITIEPCTMSSIQFSKYIEVWRSEKKKDLMRQMRRHLHDEMPFDFNIRTRQNCNMVYKDDEFRYIRDDDRSYIEKMKQYEELKQMKSLVIDQQLSEYSPKIYKMLRNIQKFLVDSKPTGKVLIYSDFRGDSGAEIVEQVLQANGYSLYDHSSPSSNTLKYTFITGQESSETRRINMDAYNSTSNKFGEQIQVMIISGAGAEGISLTCVRQVHILESYWNFVRIDQVFGRAIRLHSHDDLDPKDRNVEEYLYLSVLPSGSTIEEIYQSIQGWSNIPKLKNVKQELAEMKHKEVKETIEMVMNIGQTIDQKVFDIMERKYKVSQHIIDIIKQSSLDCIQHTRDDPSLNEQCIRFSNQLLHEISYFPGLSSSELFEIDKKQLKATFMKVVKPNHVVVSGGENEYIYYEVDDINKEIDVRYLRENGKKICSLSLDDMNIYMNVEKDHSLNESLGKNFSVYQDIFSLEDYYDGIIGSYEGDEGEDWNEVEEKEPEQKFPTIDKILSKGCSAYKIKYNINEMMFYSPNEENRLRRLYRFEEYLNNQLSKPLLILDKEVYIQD